MVVEPVEKVAVLTAPGEVGRPGMFHQTAIRIAFVTGFTPSVAAVPAVGEDWVTVDAAIDAVEGAVAEHAVALLFGDGAAAGGRTQTDFAVGQGLPGDFGRVFFREQVGTASLHPFGTDEKAVAETTDFVYGDIGRAFVEERSAHIPEEADASPVDIAPIHIHLAQGQNCALAGPGAPVIVAVFEDKVALGIDTSHNAAGCPVPVLFCLNLAQVVRVVVVETVDAATGNLEQHRVGCLRAVGWLHVHGRRPGVAQVRAAGGDDMLARISLVAAARGHDAEPGPVVGRDDIGLVCVGLGRDFKSVGDMTRVLLYG